nr:MAG TPA: hypothetical protein [Bacteriophage sp.]
MGFKFYFCTTTIVLVSSIKKEFKKRKNIRSDSLSV